PTELLSLQGCVSAQESIDLTNCHFSSIGQRLADKILSRLNKTEMDFAKTVRIKNSPVDSIFMSPTDHQETIASAPFGDACIKIHSSMCIPNTCICEPLTRTHTIKYLGVHIDENLSFKTHIVSLSGRIRKVIHVMRNLRFVACVDTLRLVYYALCQSLIVYCVTCWGCAGKSFIIQAERAQRSVL
ncbi:Uncharacterized protein OBRU01_06467, partial [Operophtera brumata]